MKLQRTAGVQRAAFGVKPAPAQRRPRRRQPVAVTATAMPQEQLAAQIAEKEAHLASLFEPGKPQPRAGQVAGLRKEISALRTQLQEGLGGGRPLAPRPAAPLSAGTAGTMLGASLLSSAAGGSAASNSKVLNALKLVEAQMAVSRQAPGGTFFQLTAEQRQEVLRLQEENTTLKAQLDAVQARQAQLLSLADQHGLLSTRGVPSAASVPANGDWPAPPPLAAPLAAAEEPAAVQAAA